MKSNAAQFDRTIRIEQQRHDKMRFDAERARIDRLTPDEFAKEQNRRCPYCNKLIVPVRRKYEVFGAVRAMFVWPTRCGCDAEALAGVDATTVLRDRSRQAEAERERIETLRRAGLVGRLEAATFSEFQDRDDYAQASKERARVMVYANALINGTAGYNNWLLLHGKPGTGKTHLAAAVCHLAIEAGWSGVYLRSWSEYIDRIKATWNGRGDDDEYAATSEAAILAELKRGRLVVIDDIDKREGGGKGGGEYWRSILYGVINERYIKQQPTIITLNHDVKDRDMARYISEAALDRVHGAAYDTIKFDGPSYRTR